MSWEVPIMRSKNWCCKLSRPLIRKDITRFWPVWGSYLAIWLLVLPIPLLTSFVDTVSVTETINTIHRAIVGAGGEGALWMTGIYGGVAALAVWSYLYQSRSASLFHALPVTRETLFVSHFTAGLGFLLVPNVLVALVTYLCQVSLGYFDPTQILCWLAVVCLESLLFYAIGTLAAHMTGSLPAMPVLYGLLNFAVVVCESLLNEFATQLYFGVYSQALRLTFLSPFIHLAQASPYVTEGYQVSSDGVHYSWVNTRYFDPEFLILLCLYALAAAALVVCALALYRRRATESAGDVIAFSWLKPIAKYCFAFGCALVLGWILQQVVFPSWDSVLVLFLCLAVGGAVGYLTAAMLLKKSFRVFQPKKLTGLLALWAVLAVLLGIWQFDLLGVESWVPRAAEVTEVTLYSDYELTLTQPQDIDQVLALHRDILEHKEELENEGGGCFARLDYTLKDGRALRRYYYLPFTEALAADPSTPTGKLAAIMDQPQRLVDNHLPPKDAVIKSIQINLHDDQFVLKAGEAFDGRYSMTYVNDDHFQQLLEAMETDIRAGRLCAWQREQGLKDLDYNYLFSVEINYDYPYNGSGTETAVLENAVITKTLEVDAETQMASEWDSVTFYSYDDPQSTLDLLVELGYLTGIPSVYASEVPNG